MQIENEFIVGRPRAELVTRLDEDRLYREIMPDTEVERLSDGVRKTTTHIKALGQSRDVRFVFELRDDGNLEFRKICDGNIWRALKGEIRLDPLDDRMTRVLLRMEGRTRAFVPELTIRVPMREQLEQMSKSLRAYLESA